MLMPISDDNSEIRIRPVVNLALIVVNVVVFIFLQGMSGESVFTFSYSTVPAEILLGRDIITEARVVTDEYTGVQHYIPALGPTLIPVYLTVITSMFMHGGWAHLLGNMLYLFIFGDNLENRLGRARYLSFYLLCGVIASLSHVVSTFFLQQNSLVPSLGASGAISGVLGAYMFLFPQKRVNSFFLGAIIPVPAYIALGIWIVFQVVSGLGMLGGGEGGVAYAAHIGGFIAGLMLIKFFDKEKNNKAIVR
jgi:membrane associated rhomboid family serine protease